MPKIIELTVELDVQSVSCPGVWLCQDGRVSLTVYALGTSYQTCLLPPIFPLMYKDVFYFRKRYQESCALSNMCCLLKDETIYCELVQWSDDCSASRGCTILAQYLGSLNDVLFPPNMCSNDGVDLLMRRSKEFPGILSPKVEIATKVRIDEVWNQAPGNSQKVTECFCSPIDLDGGRQKQVCHSARYHRKKCYSHARPQSRSRSTRFEAGESRSCCSLTPKKQEGKCACPQFSDDLNETKGSLPYEDRLNKLILESRFIDEEKFQNNTNNNPRKLLKKKLTPCVCEICRRYHELFHSNSAKS